MFSSIHTEAFEREFQPHEIVKSPYESVIPNLFNSVARYVFSQW